ncbi:LOW QUALITY PROTEIN: ribosome production factor 1-like [Pomacea canaliculata]|uniref:LOW QUALITY PROTEIN: ribosome production factor 1-like n=1 Tax=Pomacea canaliculata TaxID=400727 RepID=UPI000D72A104|nr:LOW QUALITY PROTEIN: ribosome production factor 1-like [Pomacea canaliculata]
MLTANMASEISDSLIPPRNISSIKNKERRSQLYREMKRAKKKAKLQEKKKKVREAKAMGEKAPPKQVPKTLENMRVFDETMVDPEDEEVAADEEQDELSSYFHRDTVPKILITTTDRPSSRTNKFCKELKKIIPNSEIYYRRGLDLKKIIPQAVSRDFTVLLVVNEDKKEPNGLVISHLPDGPTAHFKMTSVRLTTDIKHVGAMSAHQPELIFNNFNTRLGHSVGRLLASLFHPDPNFHGRRVVTFHNQRDFIFFRQHRYEFKNGKKVALHELGPRFTLKLRSLQKGSFDSKFGQFEWIHKRHEMETSRRKFFL